jgi:hypothetical protein
MTVIEGSYGNETAYGVLVRHGCTVYNDNLVRRAISNLFITSDVTSPRVLVPEKNGSVSPRQINR